MANSNLMFSVSPLDIQQLVHSKSPQYYAALIGRLKTQFSNATATSAKGSGLLRTMPKVFVIPILTPTSPILSTSAINSGRTGKKRSKKTRKRAAPTTTMLTGSGRKRRRSRKRGKTAKRKVLFSGIRKKRGSRKSRKTKKTKKGKTKYGMFF